MDVKIPVRRESDPDQRYLPAEKNNFGHSADWWANAVCEGKLKELQQAVQEKPSGLFWQDKFGKTLLHIAAAHNRVDVIKYLASTDFDLNATDQHGQTALHEAVQLGKVEAIHTLIEVGSDLTVANNNGLPPLHYAVDLNQEESLKALLAHSDKFDLEAKDSRGLACIHYAAIKNHSNCFLLLLEANVSPCLKTDAGMAAVNLAAYCGSADFIRVCMLRGRSKKIDLGAFTNSRDEEGNLILHAAVDSGCHEAVKVCLESEAHIDAQQNDLSTPVHFAALRGELKMLQTMFQHQPDRVGNALSLKDKSGMTALHKSVLFDHAHVSELLISKGAEMNVPDNNDQTPLLVAAAKGSKKCVLLLIKRGADTQVVDKDGRNFLHLAILSRTNLDCLILLDSLFSNSGDHLNCKDYFGFTPLHYASIDEGLSEDLLSKCGARLQVRSNNGTTALHLAAKYGCYNSCLKLLDTEAGLKSINWSDTEGVTALHHAAKNGYAKVVQLLLERGAMVHRAHCGQTAFSVAAWKGHIKAMRIMLSTNSHLIDICCKVGNTPLHYAAMGGHAAVVDFLLTEKAQITINNAGFSFFDLAIKARIKEVCVVAVQHQRWREILSTFTPTYPSPIFGLIEELPQVCFLVLERCVTTNDKPLNALDLAVNYDFSFLELSNCGEKADSSTAIAKAEWENLEQSPPPVDSMELLPKLQTREFTNAQVHSPDKHAELFNKVYKHSLPVVNHMINCGRVDLLISPLCKEYLSTKWKRYGRSCAFRTVAIHVLAALVLAIIVWFSPNSVKCYLLMETDCQSRQNASCVQAYLKMDICKVPQIIIICNYLLILYCAMEMLYIISYMHMSKLDYLLDLKNVLTLLAFCSILAYTIPSLLTPGYIVMNDYQWTFLAVASSTVYIILILELRIHDVIGIYVVMFVEILKTLFKLSFMLVLIMVGFSLGFSVLFQVPIQSSQDYSDYKAALAYSNPIVSALRSLVMATGELEFLDTLAAGLTNPDMKKGVPFPVMDSIFYLAFIIVVSIALFNLIVGLAIGDISAIQGNSTLKRIKFQCEFYTRFEDGLLNLKAGCCNTRLRPLSVTVHPNSFCTFTQRLYQKIQVSEENTTPDSITLAAESENRKHFQTDVTRQLEKHKQRFKKIRAVQDQQVHLLKLLLRNSGVESDKDSLFDNNCKTSRSVCIKSDFKSSKSKANANWQRLHYTLNERTSGDNEYASNRISTAVCKIKKGSFLSTSDISRL